MSYHAVAALSGLLVLTLAAPEALSAAPAERTILVVPAHSSFAFKDNAETPSAFETVRDAMSAWAAAQTREIGFIVYRGDALTGSDEVQSGAAAARAIAALEGDTSPLTPPLLAAIFAAIGQAARGRPGVARSVVVVTDGKHRLLERAEATLQALRALADFAKASAVRLVIIGATLDTTKPLEDMKRLAKLAKGTYVAFDGNLLITDAKAAKAALVKHFDKAR